MQKMVPETFSFEIALYLGRIKTGPKPYDDDVFAALIHNNVTKGFGFRALKTMVKSEGYGDFWGTDKILPSSGTRGEHSKEERDDAFAKLQMKLHGNPEVLKERYVTFLEFAEICFRKNFFKRESNLKIVQKALAVKKKEDSEKGMIEKAKNESLAISPELAATYKQGELQLMNVGNLEIGAEVEVSGNDVGNKSSEVTATLKKTTTTKVGQTLDLAEIDDLVMNEYQVQDVSELHQNNLLKYRDMSIKLQNDNLVLMRINDRQAKEIKLEKKASAGDVAELIDVKIKPIIETLKDLPRKMKLMFEEGLRVEKVAAETRLAEKEIADKAEQTKCNDESNSMLEHTQDMVREIYNYVKPVDVTQFESLEEEASVMETEAHEVDLLDDKSESDTSVKEVLQLEDESLADEITPEEVTTLDELQDLEENEVQMKNTDEPSVPEEEVELATKLKPDEARGGRKISVVINTSRKKSKSEKKNRQTDVQFEEKNVLFTNSERMFNSFETPRREIKMSEAPEVKRRSRWSLACNTPRDGWEKKEIEERKKNEILEKQRKGKEVLKDPRKERSLLEAQKAKERDVEETKRRTERDLRVSRERNSQETRRREKELQVLKKERDVKETQRKEKELFEAQKKEIELKETRMRKEMELLETQKKEKEMIESRKRMAKELDEARMKEETEKEKRRERDVRMTRS